MTDETPRRSDWEAIEREYRAGQLSISEIGRQHGTSKQSIIMRAKRHGWERNLAARIKEAVTSRTVTDGVTGKNAQETIELAAERGVQIVREHRTLIGKGRAIIVKLFGELEGDVDGASLKDRATAFGNLASALKSLVVLERQAFNLDADDSLDGLTIKIGKEFSGL